jgi:hypothetical protein
MLFSLIPPPRNIPIHVYGLDDLNNSRPCQRAEDILVLFGLCKYEGYLYGFLRTRLVVRVLLNCLTETTPAKKREV